MFLGKLVSTVFSKILILMKQFGDKFLIVRTDKLGDVITTLPLAEALKRKFPECYVGFLCRKYTSPVVRLCRYVDEVIEKDGCSNLVDEISRFDTAVLVHPTWEDAILLWRSGIRNIIGSKYRLYSPLFTDRVALHRKKSELHEVSLNLKLLKPLGADVDFIAPKIEVPADVANRIGEMLAQMNYLPKKFIVVHAGSGGSALSWSVGSFKRLVGLFKSKNIYCLSTFGEGEKRIALEIAGGCENNIIGGLSLVELAAVFQNASAFVGSSTGTLHLADAVGTPAFAVFPALNQTSHRRWAPSNYRAGAIAVDLPVCYKCSDDCPVYPCPETVSPETVLEYVCATVDRK
jgi:heptosyltransferase III